MPDENNDDQTTTTVEPAALKRIYFHDDDTVSFTLSDERVKEVAIVELPKEYQDQIATARAEQQARRDAKAAQEQAAKDAKAAEESQQAWYAERQEWLRTRRIRNTSGRRRR